MAKRAEKAASSNQLDEAARLYRQALTIEPAWAEGWWSLATLEYDRSNYPQAAQAFRHLLTLAPKNGTAQAMLGLCEFELGQDDVALRHIRKGKSLGVSTNPQLDQVVLYHEGVLLRRKGKFEAAQLTLGQLCSQGTEDPAVSRELGMVLLRIAGKSGPPDDSPGAQVVERSGRAECLATQKKFDQARQQFTQLVAEYPSYPNLHYAMGMFLIDSGDSSAAVEQFKLEIANNPLDITSRLKIATTLYKQDSRSALPYAQEAVQLSPQQPFAHYILGLLYLDVDDYQKSIPELEIAKKSFPEDAKVFFALGSAYSRAGRKREAAEARAQFQRLSSR